VAESIRIRVKLKGYDSSVLDKAVAEIVNAAVSTGAKVVGPILLPVKKSKYAVNRSPHIYKTSMEHFALTVHKRMLDIIDPTARTMDILQHLDMPAGVGFKIVS
jgi:small subunit ribosomal protein S10